MFWPFNRNKKQEAFNKQVVEAVTLIKEVDAQMLEYVRTLEARLSLVEQVTYGQQHGSKNNS